MNRFETALSQPSGEHHFIFADVELAALAGEGGLFHGLNRDNSTSGSFVRGGGERFSFIGGHTGETRSHCLAPIRSGRVAAFGQAITDRHFSDAEVLRDGLFGHTTLVQGGNFVNRQYFTVASGATVDLGSQVAKTKTGFSG